MSDHPPDNANRGAVELPRPTAAPLVLAVGIALAAAGVATNYALSVVGLVLLVAGLAQWIGQLRPGRGHYHEPLAEAEHRPHAARATPAAVERMRQGLPGYRLRLPEKVHPLSAGVKGGLVGGLVMPLPAMLYGLLSGHGIWLPLNLLAGMVVPGVGALKTEELDRFDPTLLVVGILIHATVSLIMGLMYGVLLPALPDIAKPLAWAALLMPLLWTAVSYLGLQIVDPTVRARIEWPWFVVSQFIFGVVAAAVFMHHQPRSPVAGGLLGGAVGGLLMPLPAIGWSLISGHGIWYPVNLLSALGRLEAAEPTIGALEQFHLDWLIAGIVVHAILSLTFGLALGLIVPRLPDIPGPLAWGGLVLPLLWTALSYALMGVVNPPLQQRVDWPWFVVSQFVFGVVAAIVVVRSEQIHVPPAGRGSDSMSQFITG